MEEDNIITIENPKPTGFSLWWIWIKSFFLFSAGSLLVWCYFSTEVGIIVLLLGLVFIIFALLGIWLMSSSQRIVVIDSDGVYYIQTNRRIPWDQIHGLTCEIDDYDHLFWCILNDGEQFKDVITTCNYSADMLYQDITEQFPNVRCTFVDNRT